jgi:hypothetical protein
MEWTYNWLLLEFPWTPLGKRLKFWLLTIRSNGNQCKPSGSQWSSSGNQCVN